MKKLTFDLYIISRLTHIYYTHELGKIGISFGEFPFLLGVYEHDGITQEELSSLLMISKSSTAAMLQKLEQSGYVRREVDPGDRRNLRLHITESGEHYIPQIYRIIDSCHEKILEGLTDAEKKKICSLVHQVKDQAERSGIKKAVFQKKKQKKRQE